MNQPSSRRAASVAALMVTFVLACGQIEPDDDGSEDPPRDDTAESSAPPTPTYVRRSGSPSTANEVGTTDPSLGRASAGDTNDDPQIERPPE